MRHQRTVAAVIALLVAGLLAGTPAFAGSRNVYVSADSYLNGTEVKRGTYNLSWKKNGSHDTVEVTLFKGNQKVATADGKMVDNDPNSEGDSLVYEIDEDGKRQIVEVRFGNKGRAIRIES